MSLFSPSNWGNNNRTYKVSSAAHLKFVISITSEYQENCSSFPRQPSTFALFQTSRIDQEVEFIEKRSEFYVDQ